MEPVHAHADNSEVSQAVRRGRADRSGFAANKKKPCISTTQRRLSQAVSHTKGFPPLSFLLLLEMRAKPRRNFKVGIGVSMARLFSLLPLLTFYLVRRGQTRKKEKARRYKRAAHHILVHRILFCMSHSQAPQRAPAQFHSMFLLSKIPLYLFCLVFFFWLIVSCEGIETIPCVDDCAHKDTHIDIHTHTTNATTPGKTKRAATAAAHDKCLRVD